MDEVHRLDISPVDSAGIGTFAGEAAGARPLDAGDPAVLIDVQGLEKTYAGSYALAGVDFQLLRGEVHALLGQNGAGKSTFIKVLAGIERPSAGRIQVLGQERSFHSAHDSRSAGIAIVYQELSLIPTMRVVDNLFLGREPRKGFGVVDRKKMLAQARAFLKEYDFPLDPRALVSELPFAYRQMTEIAKALMGNVRILVLDEPTSALSEHEEEVLFSAVRKVVARGVGVIYVTHRLSEVFAMCDRVTVLRDGSNVGSFPTAEIDMPGLVSAIVGPSEPIAAELMATEATDHVSNHQVKSPDTQSPVISRVTPFLELTDVKNDALNGVSITVRPGEIVGLAGVIGSGRTEILETIFGLRSVAEGALMIGGQHRRLKSPTDAIRLGIGLVPEDRHEQGLVLEHTIDRNLSLPLLKRLTRFGRFRTRASMRRSQLVMTALSVKAPNQLATLMTLSGGNQQKVVFGKWLEPRCELLLLDEPTVGVDVGAREEIYQVIRQAAAEGTSTLVVSSDLSELLLLCDRIYVVRDGKTHQSMARNEISNVEEFHHLVAAERLTPDV
ncbi:ribose import ATP-binding protein RbsA [Salinibacterium xinjiangense]|uniref:Monosaccharide ABC transporter ATP-binding protein, CUT2 family n=1 Tax=Salinibacterium xinjiangense TaxID=386302 RepID=A0A2C8ZUY4_9MICO|nr:sugar ABC transporter ATP-binding protein [Salinibacterium xinjiangense]GGL05896.1 ribose import ATP-binding protein RbsA [Salinibacterium xinjiangense]SOE69505.1 monosaccharide ABC transporter ATP-binding protein, CUT2 family [Salinibacterium xinjiangense]